MASIERAERFDGLNDVNYWFTNRSEEITKIVAARAAIRCIPALIIEGPDSLERSGLQVLRLALTLTSSTIGAEKSVSSALSSKWLADVVADNMLMTTQSSVVRALLAATGAMRGPIDHEERSKIRTSAIQSSCIASNAAHRDGREMFVTDQSPAFIQFELDTVKIDRDEILIKQPVWEPNLIHYSLADLHSNFMDMLSTRQLGTFWPAFYDGIWNGTYEHWDLARDIAHIPDEHWQKGPEHIARMIEGISEPYRLREQITELRAEIARIKGEPPPMGHNIPPELIDEATPQQATTIIWATISDLEQELEKDAPDPSRLGSLLGAIRALAARAGTFAKDITYDHAKAITGGTIGGLAVANWPKVQAILEKMAMTLEDWIAYLLWVAG